MNLKNRLRLIVFSMIVLLLSVVVIMAVISLNVNSRIKEVVVVDSLVVNLYELRLLNSEYIATPSERIKQQWWSKYHQINGKFNILHNIPHDIQEAFDDLQQTYLRLTSMPEVTQSVDANQKRLKNQIAATLNIESQRIIDWASDIALQTKKSLASRMMLVATITLAIMLFVGFILITIMIFITKNIFSSIIRLKKGAEAIAAGKLGFQVKNIGNDEITELGQTINQMSSSLMESYNNLHEQKTRLETEMAERQIINIELQKKTIELGKEIEERQQAEAERQKMQKQLFQSQKMEAVGTLAGGIAHDFNNILAAIIGYTELALQAKQKENQLRYLQETMKGAMRAKNLVKQILTFSRQDDHEKEPLDIKVLLKEAIKFLRASIPTTIEINQRLTEEDCNIMADPTQMHQIIMNLCTNASHAMKEAGGTLQIEMSTIELATGEIPNHPNLAAGIYVKLTVSDTGHGIDPALIPLIFDPFFTTKSKDEGTGLGLSVVYGIVKSHDGAINVYSEPDKGTTFHIYLPRIIQTEAITGDMDEPVRGGTERVLFVDDEAALVDIGIHMLSSLGYDALGVTGSIAALDLFRAESQQFDLVITDMTMPRMTGLELSRNLLQIRPDIPIILCSGIREPDTQQQAKNLGIKAYIIKPLTRRELSRMIRDTLDRGGGKRL